MLRIVASAWVGERYDFLRLAELIGVKNNQTVVRKIFSKLPRKAFERGIIGDRASTGGYDYQQVVVVHLPCQQQKVVPLLQQGELRWSTTVFFLHELLQSAQRLLVGKEMNTAP